MVSFNTFLFWVCTKCFLDCSVIVLSWLILKILTAELFSKEVCPRYSKPRRQVDSLCLCVSTCLWACRHMCYSPLFFVFYDTDIHRWTLTRKWTDNQVSMVLIFANLLLGWSTSVNFQDLTIYDMSDLLWWEFLFWGCLCDPSRGNLYMLNCWAL